MLFKIRLTKKSIKNSSLIGRSFILEGNMGKFEISSVDREEQKIWVNNDERYISFDNYKKSYHNGRLKFVE